MNLDKIAADLDAREKCAATTGDGDSPVLIGQARALLERVRELERQQARAIEEKQYNGWTNFETWALYTWMSGEEGSDNRARAQAREHYEQAEADGTISRRDRARFDFADALKEETEEAAPELEGFYADMLTAALEEIDWQEVADAYLTDELVAEIDAEEADDDDDQADDDEPTEPEEDDITTGDFRTFHRNGKLLIRLDDTQDWEEVIADIMNRENYWPNVWRVDDHGGAEIVKRERVE